MFTFRKWNPNKINVPFGVETDANEDEDWSSCCCCAPLCQFVNSIMNVAFEEVIDIAVDGF